MRLSAGRDLDALVAEKVMNRSLKCCMCGRVLDCDVSCGMARHQRPLDPYSTTWEGMRLVVERMRELGWLSVEMRWTKRGKYSPLSLLEGWSCFFSSDKPPFTVGHFEAETAPHAVCLAALAAIEGSSL